MKSMKATIAFPRRRIRGALFSAVFGITMAVSFAEVVAQPASPPGPPPAGAAGLPPGPPPGLPAGAPGLPPGPGAAPPQFSGFPPGLSLDGSPDDDDPPTATLRAHTPLPPGLPQPSSDPRNFDGAWRHDLGLTFQIMTDMYGEGVPLNEAGKKVLARRLVSLRDGTPFINASAVCRPPGQPWLNDLNFPFHIYQFDARIDLVYEEYHAAWHIDLTGKNAPASGQKPYMGRSVGRWNGNTLVVETTDFRLPLWLDVNGTPASASAKLTQRIRKVFDGHWYLEVTYTLDDSVYYSRPWSWVRTYAWAPYNVVFNEYNCEEQIGDKEYLKQSGLIPEPKD